MVEEDAVEVVLLFVVVFFGEGRDFFCALGRFCTSRPIRSQDGCQRHVMQ